MTEVVTNELMYEVLKAIQTDLAGVKAALADHTHHLLRIRSDINNLRSDELRRDTFQAQVDLRLERIETRLNLSDA